ncbi:GNAT family N-acetyltransferase [Kineococcus rubinsiae]|uniref:GNAT family N-acetyltransferase n=1 Tax=Kineococcus rubinsiae TaxID=2609562 RepID=UPI0014303E99|nr:GNAT family N-acetyltransferase [Kineococcus rubinsiae]NIZ90415.1 acetyltransferase [Kineococcus rubinsiae]
MTWSYPSELIVEAPVRLRLRYSARGDAKIIAAWLSREEVYQWWGGAPVPLEEVLAKYIGDRLPEVAVYVIEKAGRPVGLIQAWQDDGCGLDMFIAAGEQGRGVGPAAARVLAEDLTARGWQEVMVDPAVDNVRAVRAWERAGFAPTGERGVDEDHETQLMVFVSRVDTARSST